MKFDLFLQFYFINRLRIRDSSFFIPNFGLKMQCTRQNICCQWHRTQCKSLTMMMMMIFQEWAKLFHIPPRFSVDSFLLLARYVPNVAERSVWEQCIILRIDRPTDRPADRPTSHFAKFRTAISRQRVNRSTSCLVQWGFRGRRIEWTFFRFDQRQDGGLPPSWKISNGRISGTGRPIDFMFDPRVRLYRERRIEWTYFRLHQIQNGGQPPS